MEIRVYQKVTVTTRNGVEYLKPITTTTEVKLGDAKAHLDGLFDGNELLGKNK